MNEKRQEEKSEFDEISEKIHKALDNQVDCTGKNTDAILDGILKLRLLVNALKRDNEELKAHNALLEKVIFAMNS